MIRQFQKIFILALFGFFGSAAYADFEICQDLSHDTADPIASGDHEAGSAVSSTLAVDDDECGPYAGNDNEDAVSGLYGEDWGFLFKEEYDEESTSGSFSYSGTYSHYLIVLKYDGVFSAFKITSDGGSISFDWSTDCDNDDGSIASIDLCTGDGKFGNSHISIYGVDAPLVPAPTTLLLFGAALAGFGISRRRRQATA